MPPSPSPTISPPCISSLDPCQSDLPTTWHNSPTLPWQPPPSPPPPPHAALPAICQLFKRKKWEGPGLLLALPTGGGNQRWRVRRCWALTQSRRTSLLLLFLLLLMLLRYFWTRRVFYIYTHREEIPVAHRPCRLSGWVAHWFIFRISPVI